MSDENLDIREWEKNRDTIPDETEGEKERAPKIPQRSLSSAAKEHLARLKTGGRRDDTPAPRKAVKLAKPKVTKPRVSVATLISAGWNLLAFSAKNMSIPVSRTLSMQAPVAGEILEDVVRDTVVDRFLQPFARLGEGGEAVFALLGPPAIVGAIHRKPEMAPMLEPALRAALISWVRIAGPKLAEKQREADEFREQYGDTVEAIMAGIFEGMFEQDAVMEEQRAQQAREHPMEPEPQPQPQAEPVQQAGTVKRRPPQRRSTNPKLSGEPVGV